MTSHLELEVASKSPYSSSTRTRPARARLVALVGHLLWQILREKPQEDVHGPMCVSIGSVPTVGIGATKHLGTANLLVQCPTAWATLSGVGLGHNGDGRALALCSVEQALKEPVVSPRLQLPSGIASNPSANTPHHL